MDHLIPDYAVGKDDSRWLGIEKEALDLEDTVHFFAR